MMRERRIVGLAFLATLAGLALAVCDPETVVEPQKANLPSVQATPVFHQPDRPGPVIKWVDGRRDSAGNLIACDGCTLTIYSATWHSRGQQIAPHP